MICFRHHINQIYGLFMTMRIDYVAAHTDRARASIKHSILQLPGIFEGNILLNVEVLLVVGRIQCVT